MFERISEEGLSQIKKLNYFCPVCRSEYGAVLGRLSYTLFDDSPLAGSYDAICCSKCGLVFYDTPSSQDDYTRFYEKSFYSSAYIDREVSADEIKYFSRIEGVIAPFIKNKDASIFDVGCGVGRLLETLQLSGYANLCGVDPAPSCVEVLIKKNGINGEIGSMADLPLEISSADVIVLAHIIEHVLDLPQAIQEVHSKLTKDGIVYVEVPDASKYEAVNSVSPLRYFYLQHVNHFDVHHLCNLFETNGYEKLKIVHHLRVEGELLMPCVGGIFRKVNIQRGSVRPNFELARKVKRWFESISLDNNEVLANLALKKTTVYLWGLGIHAQMMLGMSGLGDCNIKYFIDGDKRTQCKTIDGKKVDSIEVLKKATELDVVVIGAPTHSMEMYRYLTEKVGFKGKVIVLGFGDVHYAP
ncbi:class I SAM-dependent methyltransferase [bacterium]|nr:class I SAM-dependent methyltransferase [bacterium]